METRPLNKIKKFNQSSEEIDVNSEEFSILNKKYYKDGIEDYDWTKTADSFRGLETFFHRKREKLLKTLIKKYSEGGKYLDAGCGSGLITRHLAKGSIGIDINPKNIKRAKKYAPLAEIIEGDVENMPFSDNNFSTIICSEVLEHMPNPQKAILEIKRVLNQNGVLIGTVPKKSFLWKLRFLSSTHPGEPYHKEYTKKELTDVLSNFDDIKVFSAGYFMTLVFIARKKD